MIDIEALERLAKDAAETELPGHRIKFFMNIKPAAVLELVAEVRRLREEKERFEREAARAREEV